jgi:hypothetical protein
MKADNTLRLLIDNFGYSHFILRKAILIKSTALDGDLITNIDNF